MLGNRESRKRDDKNHDGRASGGHVSRPSTAVGAELARLAPAFAQEWFATFDTEIRHGHHARGALRNSQLYSTAQRDGARVWNRCDQVDELCNLSEQG